MHRNCSTCGITLKRPLELNANYVTGGGFEATEPVEVHYGFFHTAQTKREAQARERMIPEKDWQLIAAEMVHPNAPATVEVPMGNKTVETEGGTSSTADTKEIPYKMDKRNFDVREVESPNEVQTDPDLAAVHSQIENRKVPKTGLVCRDCHDPTTMDTLWGPDK